MSQIISGHVTVTAAGTAVAGPPVGPGEFILQANPGNAGTNVYIGNDGSDDVSSTTGFTLAQGDKVVLIVRSLASIYFDADANGDKIEYLFCARRAGGNPLVLDP
jgi:hypothetical protein